MNKLRNWLIFSIPNTIAYTIECFGFMKPALFIYKFLSNAGYVPAMRLYGLLLCDFRFEGFDCEQGKKWLNLAAEKGDKYSQEWVEKYGGLSDDSGVLARDLMDRVLPRSYKLWHAISKIVWVAFICLSVYLLSSYL